LIYHKTVDNGSCLCQGEISWNGLTTGGSGIPDGVYVYKLYLKNCNNGWSLACNLTNSTSANGICKDYCFKFSPWPPGWKCCDDWNESCIFAVTVLH
ncbi:MAG: hypothetical protein ABIP51_02945, partial [Bacteroidia bacterium]